ncbi:MAG: Glycine--tRNA ligase 1, mitochondrial [Chrysothrix sp. TS-e1954]|nr:MAG: Glycine--tRNA ligase 1, mitochondrial [Chrysothrix sp. TS-e1954]
MTEIRTLTGDPFERPEFEQLLRRRVFYTEAFEIYRKASNFKSDIRGLFDYGPPGCALQANIVDLWRKHFVLEENMLELDCTMLTPEAVFKTSGHVDRFEDFMCRDPKSGDYLRADHLVENVLEGRLKGDKAARGQQATAEDPDAKVDAKKAKRKVKDVKTIKLEDSTVTEYDEILAKIDNFGQEELHDIIKRLDIRNPDTNNEVEPPIAFNLMFKTQIGPSSAAPGYLRPETAQGQFLNFRKLLDFNQGAMPFASASIGKSFRNEISPRAGLLRVREFLMAEIEHYVDPEGGKKHERFEEVEQFELVLLDRHTQLAGKSDSKKMAVGPAVKQKVIDNETLGYFMVRIQTFVEKLGADPKKMRFRQHMANEMAHYACDCWDLELLTSYGWIECVGCADRSAYDLTVHAKRTGEALVVREPRAEPLEIEEWQVDLEKKKLGPMFRKGASAVETAIESSDQKERERLASELEGNGKIILAVPDLPDGKAELTSDLVKIVKRKRVEHVREYTPNVIEPSFGIGRILYSTLEHVYWHRADDVARGVLSLPAIIAPTKVLVLPISAKAEFKPLIRKVCLRLRAVGVSNRVDDSGVSIGRRYARNDELGTPYGVTIDFDSLTDRSMTLRERDSTKQVRGSEDEIINAIKGLVDGDETWAEVEKRLPVFTSQSGES